MQTKSKSWWKLEGDEIIVYSPYCEDKLNWCDDNEGWYDKESELWHLPEKCLSHVQKMIGKSLRDCVYVELAHGDWKGVGQLHVGWHVLARRPKHHRPAYLEAKLIQGSIPNRGGSERVPSVSPSMDARFRLWVPRDFADNYALKIVKDPKKQSDEPDWSLLSREEILLQIEGLTSELLSREKKSKR